MEHPNLDEQARLVCAVSEKMERVGGRQEKMEGHCSTKKKEEEKKYGSLCPLPDRKMKQTTPNQHSAICTFHQIQYQDNQIKQDKTASVYRHMERIIKKIQNMCANLKRTIFLGHTVVAEKITSQECPQLVNISGLLDLLLSYKLNS